MASRNKSEESRIYKEGERGPGPIGGIIPSLERLKEIKIYAKEDATCPHPGPPLSLEELFSSNANGKTPIFDFLLPTPRLPVRRVVIASSSASTSSRQSPDDRYRSREDNGYRPDDGRRHHNRNFETRRVVDRRRSRSQDRRRREDDDKRKREVEAKRQTEDTRTKEREESRKRELRDDQNGSRREDRPNGELDSDKDRTKIRRVDEGGNSSGRERPYQTEFQPHGPVPRFPPGPRPPYPPYGCPPPYGMGFYPPHPPPFGPGMPYRPIRPRPPQFNQHQGRQPHPK